DADRDRVHHPLARAGHRFPGRGVAGAAGVPEVVVGRMVPAVGVVRAVVVVHGSPLPGGDTCRLAGRLVRAPRLAARMLGARGGPGLESCLPGRPGTRVPAGAARAPTPRPTR